MPGLVKKDSPLSTLKSKAGPQHGTYMDMITDAIIALKDRTGSGRPSLKKYVRSNNDLAGVTDNMFDALFNKALKAGVEKGVFTQPKGPSGGTKLANKPAAKPVPKVAAIPPVPAKREAKKPTKKADPPKKAPISNKKPTVVKEKPAVTKSAPKKPVKSTKKAAPASKAEAIEEPQTVIHKTKSGRITKVSAPTPSSTPKKKTAASKKSKAERRSTEVSA